MDSSTGYFCGAAGKLYKTINDDVNTGKLKLYKAEILYNVGSFDLAEIEAISALKLLYKTTNNNQLIIINNKLTHYFTDKRTIIRRKKNEESIIIFYISVTTKMIK